MFKLCSLSHAVSVLRILTLTVIAVEGEGNSEIGLKRGLHAIWAGGEMFFSLNQCSTAQKAGPWGLPFSDFPHARVWAVMQTRFGWQWWKWKRGWRGEGAVERLNKKKMRWLRWQVGGSGLSGLYQDSETRGPRPGWRVSSPSLPVPERIRGVQQYVETGSVVYSVCWLSQPDQSLILELGEGLEKPLHHHPLSLTSRASKWLRDD